MLLDEAGASIAMLAVMNTDDPQGIADQVVAALNNKADRLAPDATESDWEEKHAGTRPHEARADDNCADHCWRARELLHCRRHRRCAERVATLKENEMTTLSKILNVASFFAMFFVVVVVVIFALELMQCEDESGRECEIRAVPVEFEQ